MERCSHCRRKVIMLVTCACEKRFCMKDRMPEDHACTHDFRASGAEKLAKDNPKIEGSKISRI